MRTNVIDIFLRLTGRTIQAISPDDETHTIKLTLTDGRVFSMHTSNEKVGLREFASEADYQRAWEAAREAATSEDRRIAALTIAALNERYHLTPEEIEAQRGAAHSAFTKFKAGMKKISLEDARKLGLLDEEDEEDISDLERLMQLKSHGVN